MTNLNFTHYWDEEEIEKARPMIKEVLQDFPNLDFDEIQIGRTSTAKGRFHRERNTKHNLYLQFNPEKICKHTIAHELHHYFTREKIVDLRAISMGTEYLDSIPSYLIHEKGSTPIVEYRQMRDNHPEKVVNAAREALNQNRICPTVYFEGKIRELLKQNNYTPSKKWPNPRLSKRNEQSEESS